MSKILENAPELWQKLFPFPEKEDQKYSRGTALIRGGSLLTGATRLAARAAQRIGAGLVTIASPQSAWKVYAESLESVIVRPCDTIQEWQDLAHDKKEPAFLLGPGMGHERQHEEEIMVALQAKRPIVLDADALTLFAGIQRSLFSHVHEKCVFTPHEGEFARLFGEMEGDKVSRAKKAAEISGAIILLKGSETVIASPQGEVVINHNAPPSLATAGAGDVLAGIILGLLAQKMPVFEAAAASAWVHGRAATRFGPGLIAEDVISGIPPVLEEIWGFKAQKHAHF